jgi:uncharacterized membrane protein (DUF106 family)
MAPIWVLPTVIACSFLVSLGTQLINYLFTDQKFIKEKRSKMKELQKTLSPQSTKEELQKAQNEIMSINSELMKHTLKPTMYTFVPMLVLFWVFSMIFSPYGDLVQLPISLPLFGPAISWLGTYIIFSFIFSLTIKPLITKIGESRAKTRT